MRTSFLQEHCFIRKHPALVPCHAISQVIQLYFLGPNTTPNPRYLHFALTTVGKGHTDSHAAPLPSATSGISTRLDLITLIVVIVVIILEELATSRTRRRTLHLEGEPTAGVDGVALPERVWNFLDVDSVQRDSNPDPTPFAWIID